MDVINDYARLAEKVRAMATEIDKESKKLLDSGQNSQAASMQTMRELALNQAKLASLLYLQELEVVLADEGVLDDAQLEDLLLTHQPA